MSVDDAIKRLATRHRRAGQGGEQVARPVDAPHRSRGMQTQPQHALAVPGAEPGRSSASSPSCRSRSTSSTPSPAACSCTRRTVPTSASRTWRRCSTAATTSTLAPASATCSGAPSGTPPGTRLFQVTLMVLFSLITALVLNRKIIGRGFWRGVYFYPVLLSPVVVALIWKWILQRDGLLNGVIIAAGGTPTLWLAEPGMGLLLGRLRQHLGPHGLLHADPAGRPAGDPGRSVRSRATRPRLAVAHACRASRCRC